jgi:uncharacterized protein (TIGR02271 family)
MGVSTLQAIDQNGVRGTLDLTVIPPQGSESRLVLVRFDDGRCVFIDGNLFVEQEPGVFLYSGSFEALTKTEETKDATSERLVLPILDEQLKISREKVVTGGVRIHKTVNERIETVDEPILQEQVEVERVPVNSFVTEAPLVRYEGDVMIVPLLEEVLVVEKRLLLREELRISKRSETIHKPQQIVLRREEARLERITPDVIQAENAQIKSENEPKPGGNQLPPQNNRN